MKIEAVLLLGPTGSGKTPLGDSLERSGWNGRRCLHFDFGAELRNAASFPMKAPDLDEDERNVIGVVLAAGALLEDRHISIARKILLGFLRSKNISTGDFVILNGLPRHRGQARDLDDLIAVRLLVRLSASAGIIRDRIRTNAAGDRTGRGDDSPVEIEKKLVLFRERTIPLVGYFAAGGVPVIDLTVAAGAKGDDLRRDLVRACPEPGRSKPRDQA
jgi:adenylate kinase